MLRRVKNINPQLRVTNRVVYEGRPQISQVIRLRRLRLACYVIRGNEPTTRLFGNLKNTGKGVVQLKR